MERSGAVHRGDPATPRLALGALARGALVIAALTVCSGDGHRITGPPVPPGTVTDLAVTGTSDSSVVLEFTQVNDGTGAPAHYAIRYQSGAISWGSATPVSAGSCAAPSVGPSFGATLTCTAAGLAGGTAYQFQLVAFRGSSGHAVFGALSNVASGATVPRPSQVARILVTPAAATCGLGQAPQFGAIALDSSGRVLAGVPFTWASSNPLVATVNLVGLVTTLLVGTSTISASSGNIGGTSTLTVSLTPPPTPWVNQPLGFTTLSDQPWDGLTTLGWNLVYNGAGLASIVLDSTAPTSPGGVLQFLYPIGFAGGTAPATEWVGLPSVTSLYAGMWWKPSDPWQSHSTSGVNKIAFVYTNSLGDMFLAMYGAPGGPYTLRVLPEFAGLPVNWYVPNVDSLPITLGQWHKIEWLIQYDVTNPAAGTVQWWMDGQLIGSYANVAFPAAPFTEFQLSPTWGGSGEVKNETDYFWFDETFISIR